MNIRETYELFEMEYLDAKAAKSKLTKGRKTEDVKCEIRTDFQRDRDRIIHSKAFRRLKHKTQVFLSPEGDHYRTRLTHTLEVSQIARTIARAMKLNEDLAEAIALGHDLGHTPFGHAGEKALNTILLPTGFRHNEQSLRTVDLLEIKNEKRGLNLTDEVRDGILNHTGNTKPYTLEGQIVRISDRVAYVNHDIDDAERANIIKQEDIPSKYTDILGYTQGQRINTMIFDVIKNSQNKDEICMSDKMCQCTMDLRTYLFENVYNSEMAKTEEKKAIYIISEIFQYYNKNFDKLPELYIKFYAENSYSKEEIVKDYVAGMTDPFAIKAFKNIYIPEPWKN